MSCTANDLMNTVKSQLGVKENPNGSNNVKYNTWYYGKEVSGDKYPWCAVFVSWCFAHTDNAKDLFKTTASCLTIDSWAETNGLVIDKSKAQYGDIVLFDWNANKVADHVGFVEGVNADGTYATIEGNADNCVSRQTRNASQVLKVIRPNYNTNTERYPDVDDSKWYAEAVHYCIDKGIMVGYDNLFRPDVPITRAEVAQIIYTLYKGGKK